MQRQRGNWRYMRGAPMSALYMLDGDNLVRATDEAILAQPCVRAALARATPPAALFWRRNHQGVWTLTTPAGASLGWAHEDGSWGMRGHPLHRVAGTLATAKMNVELRTTRIEGKPA